jgi:hypothetical protein
MKLITALTSFSFVIGCLLAQPAWSDTAVVDVNGVVLTMSITKSIKESDYTAIVNEVKSYETVKTINKLGSPTSVFHFKLDSPGGNVAAALKIGRLLRKLHALAEVKENAVCLSSCVYILAGAVSRIVEGQVGIHRPYDPNGEIKTEVEQKEKYRKLGKQIVAYFKEVNIPTRLYEDSLYISPEKIKILNFNEMQAYGLNTNDPYYEEASESSSAKSHGISRQEYKVREKRAWSDCQMDTINDATDEEQHRRAKCFDAIMAGTR